MIEVNLLPGGRKKSAGGPKFSLALPKLGGGLPAADPWAVGSGAVVVVVLLLVGWMFMGVAGEAEELDVLIEAEERDSARLADVIGRSEMLQARRDSIAQRVEVIQEIDGARYLWPHLLDEVARAVPDFTWMDRLIQVTPGEQVTFRVEGRAGTVFALTSFMENLEASPFITGVRLIESDPGVADLGGGAERLVYDFVLEGSSTEPPPEIIETVPLFGPSVAVPDEED